jgi:hypothetical protein
MFQALLEKRAINHAYRAAYRKTVDDCLTVLFCGFPEGSLPSLRQRVGDWGLVRRGQAEGTNARTCSVQVAILLIRKILGSLSSQERQDLAQAFLRDDVSNPTYRGFKSMFRVLEHLQVPPALVTYLKTEIAGQLRGMSQEAIFNAWVESQVSSMMDWLRERCLAEAELKGELWREAQ